MRLVVSLLLSTIGGVGMWSVVVALPAVQAEFGVDRGVASLPYTLTMIGFGLSGIAMGRLSDRYGVMVPVIAGTLIMSLGYAAAAAAPLGRLFRMFATSAAPGMTTSGDHDLMRALSMHAHPTLAEIPQQFPAVPYRAAA